MPQKYHFYAVKKGHKIGIFNNWRDCKASIDGFPYCCFRGFNDKDEATRWLENRVYRSDGNLSEMGWKQTEEEMIKDFLHDESLKKSPVTTSSLKKSKKQLNLQHSNSQVVSKETKSVITLPPRERISVWIDGDPSGLGKISIYFGENDPRNDVDVYRWKPPVDKTRVGLACCIRAISIFTQDLRERNLDPNNYTLVFHIESKYLIKAIHNWLEDWANRRKIQDEKNKDLLLFMERQLRNSKIRIMCVRENNKKCEQMLKAKNENKIQ